MIDDRYTDEEWRSVVAAFPELAKLHAARDMLEKAAALYLNEQALRQRMARSANKRSQWLEIDKHTRELIAAIDAVDDWDAPVWGEDGEYDPRGDRAKIVAGLRALSNHARENALTYDGHSQQNAGKKNPAREQLYSRLLHVWTDILRKDLTFSPTGPVVRFFDSVLEPLLGDDKPRASTIGDVIEREERRRRTAGTTDAEAAFSTGCNLT